MNRVRSTRPGESVRKAASDWIARRDAGLSAAAESEFQTWREASPRHAEALARYEKLWSHLDRPRVAGVSPELNRDLALLQQRDRRRRVRWAGTASLLVVTVVMLGAAWWSFDQNTDVPAARPSPIAILIPERRVLTDGTVIEYPAGSAFTVDFSSTGFRRVTLARGEAHFQIARNSARPFVVRAAGVDIEAVGTAFSVQL
ncbi:MAG: FecR domain-containing protein, partial [Opitutaceae bacterium]